MKRYKEADLDQSENRETLVDQVVCTLEVEMEFLCVTGVEDKLQEDVLKTIETLR